MISQSPYDLSFKPEFSPNDLTLGGRVASLSVVDAVCVAGCVLWCVLQ